MAKGKGLSEKRAFAEADKLGGIVVMARPRPGGGWIVAGGTGTTYIVLDQERRKVLADG
jgi:hypothetical protein